MYGGNINGTTLTVGFEAMTALKRDGTAFLILNTGVTRKCAERYNPSLPPAQRNQDW